jgi:hypothetical protein
LAMGQRGRSAQREVCCRLKSFSQNVMLTIVCRNSARRRLSCQYAKPTCNCNDLHDKDVIDPALVKINLSLLVLFESIVNRRIFADRTFEFEYNQR